MSTKNRESSINNNIRSRVHAYLATIIRDMDSHAYRVGGTDDHVHIACTLPRILSQSELVKKNKTSSSKWIKEQGVNYIDNQVEHHRKRTFQDVFLSKGWHPGLL